MLLFFISPRADFFEDEAVEQILKYNPWWTDTYSEMLTILGKSQEQENHATLGKKLKSRPICLPPVRAKILLFWFANFGNGVFNPGWKM